MARCASGNGLIAARMMGWRILMVRSQRVVSASASGVTGFNSVRGVQGINVIQQSIPATR